MPFFAHCMMAPGSKPSGLRELISNGVGGLLLLLPAGLAPQAEQQNDKINDDSFIKVQIDTGTGKKCTISAPDRFRLHYNVRSGLMKFWIRPYSVPYIDIMPNDTYRMC